MATIIIVFLLYIVGDVVVVVVMSLQADEMPTVPRSRRMSRARTAAADTRSTPTIFT